MNFVRCHVSGLALLFGSEHFGGVPAFCGRDTHGGKETSCLYDIRNRLEYQYDITSRARLQLTRRGNLRCSCNQVKGADLSGLYISSLNNVV